MLISKVKKYNRLERNSVIKSIVLAGIYVKNDKAMPKYFINPKSAMPNVHNKVSCESGNNKRIAKKDIKVVIEKKSHIAGNVVTITLNVIVSPSYM